MGEKKALERLSHVAGKVYSDAYLTEDLPKSVGSTPLARMLYPGLPDDYPCCSHCGKPLLRIKDEYYCDRCYTENSTLAATLENGYSDSLSSRKSSFIQKVLAPEQYENMGMEAFEKGGN